MWEADLTHLLRTDKRTKFLKIQVEQEESVVRLTGITTSWYQKQLAQAVVLNFIREKSLSLDNQIFVEFTFPETEV